MNAKGHIMYQQALDDEFVTPTENLLDNLGPGCFVLIDQGKDSTFWVEIDDTDGYIFSGRVHSQLSGGIACPYLDQSRVMFKRDEIYRLGCDRYCFC